MARRGRAASSAFLVRPRAQAYLKAMDLRFSVVRHRAMSKLPMEACVGVQGRVPLAWRTKV